MSNSVYILVHEHGYGASAFLFRLSTGKTVQDLLLAYGGEKELAARLGADYEPEKNEGLEIIGPIDNGDIPTLL